MKKLWYLLLFLFTLFVGFYFFIGWYQLPEGHRYIYILDDVYIHLAMARNFAESGVWSINSTNFDSASSSILYTLLLSFFIKVIGNWEYYPLVINIFFGYLTIYAFYRYFRDFYGFSELKWGIVLLMPFTMLYFMVLIGMEHTIHMFLTVLAVYYIQRNVQIGFSSKLDFRILLIIVFFLGAVRFESMFFTVSLAFALFLSKQFRKGFSVIIFGTVSILVFGIISLMHQGYFFPNSVMLKGSYPNGSHLLANFWQIFLQGILLNLSFYKCLFFPFILISVFLIKKYRKINFKREFVKQETLIITIVCTGILHALFSVLKYRYENYLMIAVLMIISPIIVDVFKDYKKKKSNFSSIAGLVCIFSIIAISIYRFASLHEPLMMSSKGINEQQVEMSRFLGKYYRGKKVVANDIGAIAYFSHVQLLDIVGLGSTEIAKNIIENKQLEASKSIKNQHLFLTDYVKENNFEIAVIYPGWFPGEIPSNWIPVASWSISDKSYGPARKTVVFYALRNGEILPLKKNLERFNLNKNVKQVFFLIR